MPRGELFITSKLRNSAHARDKALRAFDETMKKLGLDQLDLFLIHWPIPSQDRYVEAWKTLVELRDAGRIRSIGTSNFNQDHLERIIGETGVTPVVNQIELHPRFQQRDKRAFHKAHNIAIESWSPLGSGRLIADPVIGAIAKKHGKSPAQVMIRWHLDQGLIVIPKSVTPSRIRENFAVFDFALDDDDREDDRRDWMMPTAASARIRRPRRSCSSGALLPVNHQQVLGVDLAAGADQHLGDGAVALGVERGFHLHRLDGEEHVAGLDVLAGLDGERRDDARHRRRRRGVAFPSSALRRTAPPVAPCARSGTLAMRGWPFISKKTRRKPSSSVSPMTWLRMMSVLPRSSSTAISSPTGRP